MPRKIRQLKAALSKAGFSRRSAKGSHTYWTHRLLPGERITISGNDGDDAQYYQEKDVRDALANLREAQRRQP